MFTDHSVGGGQKFLSIPDTGYANEHIKSNIITFAQKGYALHWYKNKKGYADDKDFQRKLDKFIYDLVKESPHHLLIGGMHTKHYELMLPAAKKLAEGCSGPKGIESGYECFFFNLLENPLYKTYKKQKWCKKAIEILVDTKNSFTVTKDVLTVADDGNRETFYSRMSFKDGPDAFFKLGIHTISEFTHLGKKHVKDFIENNFKESVRSGILIDYPEEGESFVEDNLIMVMCETENEVKEKHYNKFKDKIILAADKLVDPLLKMQVRVGRAGSMPSLN